MYSKLESFSSELFLEIFDYLTSVDILYAFTNLNSRLTAIIHVYSFQIDFQLISPLKFHFICRHLPYERVHSFIFSETYMFNQIEQFQNYFPKFQQRFSHLKNLKFIKTKHFIHEIPQSVTSLTFNLFSKCAREIHPIIIQQMKVLKYLRVSYMSAIPQSNIQFPKLTHLIIDNFGSIYNLERILPYTENSITHLKISFGEKNNINEFFLNFQKLYQYLSYIKHLSIKFDFSITFNLLTNFLLNFSQLKYLTVEAEGSNDLIDGTLWENFLSKTYLRTFNFRFHSRCYSEWPEKSVEEIMQSFRSLFWITEKRWYVGYRYIPSLWHGYNEIYSIPHFCPTTVPFFKFNDKKLISTTAPLAIEKQMFSSAPNSFSFDRNDDLTKLLNYYFNNIKQLEFDFHLYRSMFAFDNLKNIMNLNHVQCLDISQITFEHSSVQVELQNIVNHMPNLNYLSVSRLDFPLDLPPNIHFLDLSQSTEANKYPIELYNIAKFQHGFRHVQQLHVTVRSDEIICAIIDRFPYLKLIVFKGWDEDILGYISVHSFEQNSQRLKTVDFTWKIDYPKIEWEYGKTYKTPWYIYLSINDIN